MKLKRKLILSAVALAACAATLTSTTFAWYTSNSEVTATSATGSTTTAGDSLLLISDTGNTGDWGSETDFADQPAAKVSSVSLAPVAWGESGMVAKDGTTSVTTGWIQFDLYFATGKTEAEAVYVKTFELVNAQEGSLPSKSVLTTAGLGTDWDATEQGTYKIDIRNALNVTTVTSTITAGTPGQATTAHFGVEYQADSTDDDYADGFNAHDYYKGVLGEDSLTVPAASDYITKTELTTKSSETDLWNLGNAPVVSTTTDSNALKVTFYVWLDGWDTACFDACQGQSITLNMTFTSNAADTAIAVGLPKASASN